MFYIPILLDDEGREGVYRKRQNTDKRMGKVVAKEKEGRKEILVTLIVSQTGNRLNKLNTNCS